MAVSTLCANIRKSGKRPVSLVESSVCIGLWSVKKKVELLAGNEDIRSPNAIQIMNSTQRPWNLKQKRHCFFVEQAIVANEQQKRTNKGQFTTTTIHWKEIQLEPALPLRTVEKGRSNWISCTAIRRLRNKQYRQVKRVNDGGKQKGEWGKHSVATQFSLESVNRHFRVSASIYNASNRFGNSKSISFSFFFLILSNSILIGCSKTNCGMSRC